MLLWLYGCAPEEKVSDHVPPAADTGTCELGDITLTGDPVPGATVTLVTTADATWTVSAGTLSADTGTTVDWTLPTDIAIRGPETLTVTAAGCDTEVSTDVPVDWPEADRVVVLYNPSIDGSEAVADYYAAFRGIPEGAMCGVAAADSTTLAGADFEAYVTAVQACIDAVGPQVQYVVPVYGVPYKVSDRIHDLFYTTTVTTVSLDALLVYGTDALTLTDPVDNQVYRRGDSTTYDWNPYKPFGEVLEHLDGHYYLVARIDSTDADAAMDLVDRTADAVDLAAAGALAGVVYVDGNEGDVEPDPEAGYGSYEWGEWNMWGTRHVFEALGTYDVVWDGNAEEFGTAPAPLTCPDALYYAGWYQFGHYNDAFTWAPGAIGGHLDSCSACDLRATDWSAEALKRGITATFGAVNEPYVTGMPEYDQLFLYLTQGASYGEAAYEATTVGAWMMVFVGDPLYRPYPAG